MATTITVTPWMLAEIPIKVEFSRLGDDTGFIDYPRLYVGDAEIDVPRSWNLEMALYQVYERMQWRDPFSESEREELNRIISHYHKPVSMIGYPVSLDPNGQYLTVGYPLEPRPLTPTQIEKAIQKFLALPLNQSGLSSTDERRALYDFARKYGLWVPFESLAKAINGVTPGFDPNASMSAIQEKWRVLVNESFGLPYRHYQDLHLCQFQGEWFGWPELMKLWHEASKKMSQDLKKKNAIEDALLQRMVQACAVASKPLKSTLPSISFADGSECVFYMVMSWKSSILDEHFKAYKKFKNLISRHFVPHNVPARAGYEYAQDPNSIHANRVHGGPPRGFSDPEGDEDLLDDQELTWLAYIRRVNECVDTLKHPQNQLIRMCFLDEPKKTQRQAHEQYEAQGYSFRGIEREIEKAKQTLEKTLSKIQIPNG